MKKSDIKKRIDGLNEYMLADTDKHLLMLSISSDYTYNKAIALVDKEINVPDWYGVDYKNCFKTWDEADAFIDGLCLAKNTNFKKENYENER